MKTSTLTTFIAQQTCASICCLDDTHSPYCFSCYYVFNEQSGLLYFKSAAGSKHTSFLKVNPIIAGTILPDKAAKLITKGIQLKGELLPRDHPLCEGSFEAYHKKFPLALAMRGDTYTIQLSWIKMTDSTKILGTKTVWNRDDPES